jgi:ABC-type transport system involved in multi-copper enzyme maturation permease subunit
MPLLALLIALLLIFTVGIVKSSILGSMRLNSIAPVMNLDADLEFTSRCEDVLGTLKSWNKILRGKKPIYTTSGGSQISMDSIGEEKSIKLFKRF